MLNYNIARLFRKAKNAFKTEEIRTILSIFAYLLTSLTATACRAYNRDEIAAVFPRVLRFAAPAFRRAEEPAPPLLSSERSPHCPCESS
jgi:hypothetical protein